MLGAKETQKGGRLGAAPRIGRYAIAHDARTDRKNAVATPSAEAGS